MLVWGKFVLLGLGLGVGGGGGWRVLVGFSLFGFFWRFCLFRFFCCSFLGGFVCFFV